MKPSASPRERLLATVSEAKWQDQVLTWAARGGWLVYHVHDSRVQEWGTHPGFPDLVLCRPPHVLFVELKRSGGRPTPAQATWLDKLAHAEHVSSLVWMPHDEAKVRAILIGEETAPLWRG